MSLSIQVHSDSGSVVVALAGAADNGVLEPLRDPLIAALDDTDLLVLDLDELTTVDGPGLRALLVEVIAAARGGRLRIAAGRPAILASLAGAGIQHLVGVHRTVAAALAGEQEGVAP